MTEWGKIGANIVFGSLNHQDMDSSPHTRSLYEYQARMTAARPENLAAMQMQAKAYRNMEPSERPVRPFVDDPFSNRAGCIVLALHMDL